MAAWRSEANRPAHRLRPAACRWLSVLVAPLPVAALFCPNTDAPANAPSLLLQHQRALRERGGFRPTAPGRDLRDEREWGPGRLPHYEDEAWAKPGHCSSLHPLHPYKQCNFANAWILAPDNRTAVRMVWKAGITAVKAYFWCAFHRRLAIRSSSVQAPSRFVGMARSPVDRLISGYSELLGRLAHPMRAPDGTIVRLPDGSDLGRLYHTLPPAPSEARILAAAPSGAGIPAAHGSRRGRALLRRTVHLSDYTVNSTNQMLVLEARVRASGARWLLAGYDGELVGTVRAHEIPRVTRPLDDAARFRAFIRELECAPRYAAWAHVASTSGFLAHRPVISQLRDRNRTGVSDKEACVATVTNAVAYTRILRQESLEADLDSLVSEWRAEGALSGTFDDSTAACKLSRAANAGNLGEEVELDPEKEAALLAAKAAAHASNPTARSGAKGSHPDGRVPRSGSATVINNIINSMTWRRTTLLRNAAGFPSKAFLMEILDAEPELMRIVCRVYYQDFVCMGYTLPRACRGADLSRYSRPSMPPDRSQSLLSYSY